MRPRLLILLAVTACGSARRPTTAESNDIAAHLEAQLRGAYDLTKPNVAERMLSLYAAEGRVVSATGGRVIASRDSIALGIRYFWNNVGTNMRNPRWVWDRFYVDVLSPNSAVVTATYRVPHLDPHNNPHLIAGAMTEVFEKRGERWVVVQEHLSDLPATSDSSHASMPTHQHQ